MSTEPFETRTEDPFQRAQPIRFPNRADSPAFYGRPTPEFIEQAKTLVVTKDGKPVKPGFTLYEVAPERWYAVQPDGELYSQLDFEQLHERAYVEFFRTRGQPAPDPYLRAIPKVEEFVRFKVDHTGKSLERIHKPKVVSGKMKPKYTATGDLATPEAIAAAHQPSGFEVKVEEEAPEVDEETVIENNVLRSQNEELMAMVEELKAKVENVEPMVVPAGKLEKQKHAGDRSEKMACGRVIKGNRKMHLRHCKVCRDAEVEDAEITEDNGPEAA